MVPDDVLANVRISPSQIVLWSHNIYVTFAVHGAQYVWTWWAVADAETVCPTNCLLQFHDLSILSRQSPSGAVPNFAVDRFDCNDRIIAWYVYSWRSPFVVVLKSSFLATHASHPLFATNDVVPFRLTPNMQNFLGPIFTEGLLAPGIMAIGRSLTEPEVRTTHFPPKNS